MKVYIFFFNSAFSVGSFLLFTIRRSMTSHYAVIYGKSIPNCECLSFFFLSDGAKILILPRELNSYRLKNLLCVRHLPFHGTEFSESNGSI